MTWTPSRRAFLGASTLALAGGWDRSALALPRSSRPISALDPRMEQLSTETLRALVGAGLDAARQAGAQYADIRIGNQRELTLMQDLTHAMGSNLRLDRSYGIRVQVNGVWAFAYGTVMTTDQIAQSARSAVATARGLSRSAVVPREMIPAPVATGEWRTPFTLDPFEIAPDEHARLLGAFCEIVSRALTSRPNITMRWIGETRVFGSTDGALTIQHYTRCDPRFFPSVTQGLHMEFVGLMTPGLESYSMGFERLADPSMQEALKATVDEMWRLAQLPVGMAEVGRYATVFDGAATAAFMGATLAPALRLSRALGEDADDGGTSCLSPIDEILGRPLFSPSLNIVADRAMPRYGATQWDDEGMKAEPFPLIEKGAVVDYLTTRLTAPALANWYAKRGKPLRTYGSAVANTAASAPSGYASHLSMLPDSQGSESLDAMVKQLGDGLLMRGAGFGNGAMLDPTLASGVFMPVMLYEVKKGQITRRLRGQPYMQFDTRKFWKQIVALGGPATVGQRATWSLGGGTATKPLQTFTAPAMLVSQADVLVMPLPMMM